MEGAAAQTQDAAAEVRIQNSEARIIKGLHIAIDAGKPLLGLFAPASMKLSFVKDQTTSLRLQMLRGLEGTAGLFNMKG